MPAPKTINVGTARARTGQWATGTLTVGHYPDGPITAPVNVLRGSAPGPTLWVQCAIHGTEVGGAIGLLQLFKRLDPEKMKGAIIGVMATNPTAFRSYARNTPLDGENLNRLFPGHPAGPHSHQSADVLFRTAFRVADVMMDLHSGGDEAIVPFYGLYFDDGSPAAQEARRLVEAVGSEVVWASQDSWLDGAMFVNFTRRGKPGLIVECGGGGAVPEQHVKHFAGAIEGVAKAMGILPGQPRRQKRYRVVGNCELVFNRSGGYFLPDVAAGDTVRRGRRIGRVMDPYGAVVEEITSPNGPAYIAAIARAYLPVHSGAMVAECIEVITD